MPAGTIQEAQYFGKMARNKALSAAEHVMVKGLFVPPGYHRLYNAIGLSLGLFMGRQMMNVIVGHKPDGTPIPKESVPLPLRPLHGLIDYNPYSDKPEDRWMKVADNLAPALFGAIGAMAGSSFFFTQQIMKASKLVKLEGDALRHATFEATESAMALEQSKPWWGAAGATSLFGSASMLNWLYGFTLGVNFMMRSGRKAFMGMPFMKWFSNTQANHPSGPSGVINEMMNVLAHNSNFHHPETQSKIAEYGEGTINYLIKKAPAGFVDKFVAFICEEAKTAKDIAQSETGKVAPEKVASILSERFHGGQFERFLHQEGIILNPGDIEEARKVFSIGDYGILSKPAAMMPSIQRNMEGLWERFAKGQKLRIETPATGASK